jgi:Fe2+ transport system protein FeoA
VTHRHTPHGPFHFPFPHHPLHREHEAPPDGLLRLSSLAAGQCATVHSLEGGHGLVSRMISLGFSPGAEVTMLQNHTAGPLTVTVRSSRIALGRIEAGHVLVELLKP